MPGSEKETACERGGGGGGFFFFFFNVRLWQCESAGNIMSGDWPRESLWTN